MIDASLGRGFLYPLCLRPLVDTVGVATRAAGFHGAPAHQAAYVTMLTRSLLRRSGRLDLSSNVHVDLRRVALDAPALTAIVEQVSAAIEGAGGSPVFQLPESEPEAAFATALVG